MVRLVKQATARPRQSEFVSRAVRSTQVKVEGNGNIVIDLNNLASLDEVTKQKLLTEAKQKLQAELTISKKANGNLKNKLYNSY